MQSALPNPPPDNLFPHARAVLSLVVATLLWSTTGLLIKWIAWNPLAITGVRSLLAAGVLFLFLRRELVRPSSLLEFGAAALLAAAMYLYVAATKETTATNAILLMATAPVYVALFGGWMVGENATLKDWLTIGAVGGGLLLVFGSDFEASRLWGSVYGALGGGCRGLFLLLLRKLETQEQGSSLRATFLALLLCSLLIVPVLGQEEFPDPFSWVVLICLGIFGVGIPYALQAIAIKDLKALEVALLPIPETLLTPVWVYLFYVNPVGQREFPNVLELGGGALILIAVFRYTYDTEKKKDVNRG